MITHSKAILYILLIDMAALLMYNVSGMCVTGASCRPQCHQAMIALIAYSHRPRTSVLTPTQ